MKYGLRTRLFHYTSLGAQTVDKRYFIRCTGIGTDSYTKDLVPTTTTVLNTSLTVECFERIQFSFLENFYTLQLWCYIYYSVTVGQLLPLHHKVLNFSSVPFWTTQIPWFSWTYCMSFSSQNPLTPTSPLLFLRYRSQNDCRLHLYLSVNVRCVLLGLVCSNTISFTKGDGPMGFNFS